MSVIIEKPGDYMTRSGEKVRVECTRNNGATANVEITMFWRCTNGRIYDDMEDPHDIVGPWVEPRKPVEGWVNVQSRGAMSGIYSSRALADESNVGRIACVFVRECETPEEKT